MNDKIDGRVKKRDPKLDPRGRKTEERTKRCADISRSTGERCGSYPLRGSTKCKFHGGRIPGVREQAAWRLEIARALADGRPHPAVALLEVLKLRWSLTADGKTLTCALDLANLGWTAEEVIETGGALLWTDAWERARQLAGERGERDFTRLRAERAARRAAKKARLEVAAGSATDAVRGGAKGAGEEAAT